MTSAVAAVAAALDYPGRDAERVLRETVDGLEEGPVRSELERFLDLVGQLDQGAWEELHTRTLDLSPLFVPYVGHVVWGESYRRGAFMADLRAAQVEIGVKHPELPDHLAPVLGYLDRSAAPLADLVEVLPQAIGAMRKDLRKSEPDNPYRHVLAAAAAAVDARLSQGVAP